MSIQRGRELFSKEQRKLFMKYPEDEWTIGSYYTFSKYDLSITFTGLPVYLSVS